VKKSHARIASAWERRNSDQVGPVRRGAGSMPAVFKISHTVDAAFSLRLVPTKRILWVFEFPAVRTRRLLTGLRAVVERSGGHGRMNVTWEINA
jgi:hypothetical protein